MKIIDQYTDLDVSRQRKWQLRHADKYLEGKQRWEQSEAGKRSRREINLRYYKKQQAVDKTLDIKIN